MVKSLPKILYHGVKLFAVSLRKSIQEEIRMSRDLAKIRYQDRAVEKVREKMGYQMSLEEAQRILDVKQLDKKEVNEKFKLLFSANKGLMYLQSKVFRAKEVIDLELKSQEKCPEKIKNQKHLQSNGKYLFFTYVLLNEKQ